MNCNSELLEQAKKAADRLFSERSIGLFETRAALRDLQEHIIGLIHATEQQMLNHRNTQ